MTLASVVVPTWRAADTLAGAVGSALRQTVADIEVIVVGDGVEDDTRRIVADLSSADPRVRFLDLPKAPGRGEANRDRGVREAASDVIVYLADDDLLLPRHVELLLEALREVPFAQSRNGFIGPDDQLGLFPTDLSQERWLRWHLLEPARNRVSITGTAHTKSSYLALPTGWEVPPHGWADLHLWRQFFRSEGFRAVTLPDMTTLQFPAPDRAERSAEDWIASFRRWEEFTKRPDAHEELQRLAREAADRMVIELSALAADQHFELDALRESLSWRVTRPLRGAQRVWRRLSVR